MRPNIDLSARRDARVLIGQAGNVLTFKQHGFPEQAGTATNEALAILVSSAQTAASWCYTRQGMTRMRFSVSMCGTSVLSCPEIEPRHVRGFCVLGLWFIGGMYDGRERRGERIGDRRGECAPCIGFAGGCACMSAR